MDDSFDRLAVYLEQEEYPEDIRQRICADLRNGVMIWNCAKLKMGDWNAVDAILSGRLVPVPQIELPERRVGLKDLIYGRYRQEG